MSDEKYVLDIETARHDRAEQRLWIIIIAEVIIHLAAIVLLLWRGR